MRALIFAALLLSACDTAPKMWLQFVSPDNDFGVSAPGQLIRAKPAPDVVPNVGFQLTATDNPYGVYFHVKRLDFPKGMMTGLSSKILNSALDSVRDQDVSAIHGQLIGEVPITLGSNTGREIRVSADSGRALATQRMYFAGDRLYVISAVRRPSQEADAAVLRFLDSFHLITR